MTRALCNGSIRGRSLCPNYVTPGTVTCPHHAPGAQPLIVDTSRYVSLVIAAGQRATW